MGKLLLTAGILLILFFVVLMLVALLPTDWLLYVVDKIVTLLSGEPRHIYMKVVPGSGIAGYLFVAATGVIGMVLTYYGVKLNKNSRK